MDAHIPQRESKISAVSLELKDVQKIFSWLERLVHEEGDHEIAKLTKPKELSPKQWASRKVEIKKVAFRVTVTLEGENGDRLHGDNEALFQSPNRPTKISRVYMTNSTAFRWWTNRIHFGHSNCIWISPNQSYLIARTLFRAQLRIRAI